MRKIHGIEIREEWNKPYEPLRITPNLHYPLDYPENITYTDPETCFNRGQASYDIHGFLSLESMFTVYFYLLRRGWKQVRLGKSLPGYQRTDLALRTFLEEPLKGGIGNFSLRITVNQKNIIRFKKTVKDLESLGFRNIWKEKDSETYFIV